MNMTLPQKQEPPETWEHHDVWVNVRDLIYALPNYFQTEIVIKGINATDLYSVGGLLANSIEQSLTSLLNKLRSVWDPDNKYPTYSFRRQAQTFPDVLLSNVSNRTDILFGIELKSWYVLSKEGEPSLRFKIDPDACSNADLLVVVPWLLSDIMAGNPTLLVPYIEYAKYVAELRNYHWTLNHPDDGDEAVIRPSEEFRRPYPNAKEDASDKGRSDGGSNFGRVARTGQGGVLDTFLEQVLDDAYSGVKVKHWIKIFKSLAEGKTDQDVENRLDTALGQTILDLQT